MFSRQRVFPGRGALFGDERQKPLEGTAANHGRWVGAEKAGLDGRAVSFSVSGSIGGVAVDLIVRNAFLAGRESLGPHDVAIARGRIQAIEPHIAAEAAQEVDAGGALLSMGFIDPHVHFDKCLTQDRLRQPGVYRHLRERIAFSREVKRTFTAHDVYTRAVTALKMAVANGTTTVRTHAEADPIVGTAAVEGVLRAKQEMAGYVDVQVVAFPQEGWAQGEFELDCRPYIDEAMKMGADVVGGNVNAALWESDARRQVDDLFELARRYDADLDIHLDNADNAVAFSLPYVLDQMERYGFQGRVVGSHVVGLAHVPDELASRTISRIRAQAMTICVLPIRIRLTRVDALLEAGVNVTCGTDNMQDAFTGMGTANVLQALHLLAHVTRRTREHQLEEIFEMATTNAARALRLDHELGLAVGKRADLVLLEATSRADAIRRIARVKVVIKNGRIVARDGQLC